MRIVCVTCRIHNNVILLIRFSLTFSIVFFLKIFVFLICYSIVTIFFLNFLNFVFNAS